MAFDLIVNGTRHTVDADPQTPLLWVIRDQVGLTGTKFSCAIGQCGACTLLVDGRPLRSCSVPASAAIGKPVMTIEGLSSDGSQPIQVAWKEFDGTRSRLRALLSENGGNAWREHELAAPAGASVQPRLLERQGRFYVVWNTRQEPLSVIAIP